MIPVKLNGKEYKFPTHLSELSLKTFFDLKRSDGIAHDIAILSGMDKIGVQNLKSLKDVSNAATVLKMLKDNFEPDLKAAKMPKTIQIGNKIISIPKNPRMEPVGAFIAVSSLIADQKNLEAMDMYDDKVIIDVLANYLFIPYYGESVLYSDEKVEDPEYRELIMNSISMLDAMTIYSFFFQKFWDL